MAACTVAKDGDLMKEITTARYMSDKYLELGVRGMLRDGWVVQRVTHLPDGSHEVAFAKAVHPKRNWGTA